MQVFVVHHLDSTLDVLAADTTGWFDRTENDIVPLRGLREPVHWSCEAGCFDSAGAPTTNMASPSKASTRAASIGIERRCSPTEGSSSRRTVVVRATPYDGRHRLSGVRARRSTRTSGQAVDLVRARLLHGNRVTVDADLVFGGDAGPRLCHRRLDGKAGPRCDGVAVPALGITWGRPDKSWSIAGPFSVRVTDDGFAEVTSHGATPVPDGTIRPLAWQKAKVDGSLAAFGAIASGTARLGAEGALAVHATLWPWDGWPMALIGADAGVALRGRWLDAPHDATSEFRAGIALLLENSDMDRDWSYPSLLGLLVPEVGVGRAEGDFFPYLGWSFPVTFHLESIRFRRHPFGVRDVLGIRVAPTALLSIRAGANEWQYGLSVGATLW